MGSGERRFGTVAQARRSDSVPWRFAKGRRLRRRFGRFAAPEVASLWRGWYHSGSGAESNLSRSGTYVHRKTRRSL